MTKNNKYKQNNNKNRKNNKYNKNNTKKKFHKPYRKDSNKDESLESYTYTETYRKISDQNNISSLNFNPISSSNIGSIPPYKNPISKPYFSNYNSNNSSNNNSKFNNYLSEMNLNKNKYNESEDDNDSKSNTNDNLFSFTFVNDKEKKSQEKDSNLPLFFDQKNEIDKSKPETLLHILFPNVIKDIEKEKDLDINQKKQQQRKRNNFLDGEPIEKEIDSLEDLIELAESIDEDYDKEKTYVLDLESLKFMLPSLKKLQSMIGLNDIKSKIVNQILFYLQGLDESNQDMLHTVIEGGPGVGKTEIAKILGEIYNSLGILSNGKFTSVKRSDLIGGYLGQTASKTQKVLEKSNGGVLFIDEAYSLGNEEGKDIYSKECIDTITAFLSENKNDFVCIIAGYRDSLRECFFKYNRGLERRFPWTYTINSYNEYELKKIYEKMASDNNWKVDCPVDFFRDKLSSFKNFGGDMETLFHKSKLAHSKRSLKLSKDKKKLITSDDLQEGYRLFKKDTEEKTGINLMMYT